MKKEIVYEKYKFRKYDSNYKRLFFVEKAKLKKIFPTSTIEHIGSTAVLGLGGKGIIDINLGIKKRDVKKSIARLKNNKYIFVESAGDGKERWFFKRDYVYNDKIRRVHVHLTLIDSHTWKKCLKFRDHLRSSKNAREKYTNLKKKAILLEKTGKAYRNYKKKFIENI